MSSTSSKSKIFTLDRPHTKLLAYYGLSSLVAGPFFPFAFLFGLIRFRTLRYRFDDEGISMTWGALFRREVHLTYDRIQDIHLTSNALERWLGLAKIQIQTASGAAKAEMTIEGLREFAEIRDFLYSRMRGARGLERRPPGEQIASSGQTKSQGAPEASTPQLHELQETLLAVASELRRIREALEAQAPEDSNPAKPDRSGFDTRTTESATPEEVRR